MTWRTAVRRSMARHRLPPRADNAVLLTFDDGPHPDGTPAVLDVLRRYGARGVFFIVGSRVPRAPEILRRIVDEGHVLGNHSHAHPLGPQLGLAACRRDLDECQRVVESLSGCRPRLFRPPLGRLSPASLIAPRLAGLTPVFWSVDSDDWRLRSAADVPAAADRLLVRLASPRLREIVLFHDEKPLTAALLHLVLPALVARNVDLRPDLSPRPWYLSENHSAS